MAIFVYIAFENLESIKWKYLQIYCSIPSLFNFICSLIFLEESPRFLLAINKKQEAIDLIIKIIEINNREKNKLNSEEISELLIIPDNKNNEEKESGFLDLLKGNKNKQNILVFI